MSGTGQSFDPGQVALLLRQSGVFDVVMETGGGESRVRLDAMRPAFIMPRGTWNRFETVEPGAILFATYGRGTEHKPVEER